MKYLLALLFWGLNLNSFSQNTANKTFGKPSLDTSVFSNWPSLSRFGISNDGKFVYYTAIQGGNLSKEYLIIKSLSGRWQVNIANTKGGIKFTVNNTKLFCLNSGDSLCIVTLGDNQVRHISQVRSFDLFESNTSNFVIYQKISSNNDLICLDLQNNKEVVIKNVTAYLLNVEANQMIIKTDSLINGQHRQFLYLNYIGQSYRSLICQGDILSNLVLNKKTDELAFIKEDNRTKSIWLSKLDSPAMQLIFDTTISIQKDLQVDRISKFSQDGSKLFIYLKPKPLPQAKPGFIKLNVWSFTDAVIQSRQLNNLRPQSYLAVMDLMNKRVARLQNENDKSISFGNQNETLIYLVSITGDEKENYWNNAAKSHERLISIGVDKTKIIENPPNGAQVSPDGKYLIGLDDKFRDIYSYEFSTGKTINLTKSLPVDLPVENLQRDIYDRPNGKNSRGLNFAAWVDENKILVYDEFDIWKIDLNGKEAPINITNGFGQKKHIEFRLINPKPDKTFALGEKIIISAFNKENKKSGFYEIAPRTSCDPYLLSRGDYILTSRVNTQSLIKAEGADTYLVQRESATESRNLYWTTDFKTFNLISSIFPEKQFNWLTSELKSFKTLDGRMERGVLYKPENFDLHEQYPVIIHYYERKSDELNKFRNPSGDDDGGNLDIAWFVSHGYIVFTPDIHYTIGEPGKSAYNSVVGAAIYLQTLSYVNAHKIGIQGHSFGGYETNYLIANTKMFAAAISSSGPSNFITAYLSDNTSEQRHCEVEQNRLGKSLWEDLPMYIENSPVFKAYRVRTPIMLVHNKVDNNVPFIQGLEWFMALRRLGKRAWMLQYDDGGHGVSGNDYIDYVIRCTQFFDHYLKDSACPKWMLYGIPAKMKGLDDGLELVRELDNNNKWLTPREGGLLTDEQKKKVQSLKKETAGKR